MRGRTLTIAVVTTVLLAALAPTLLAVTRTDRDDFEIAPDVHRSTKAVSQLADESWRLRLSVSGEVGPDYRLRVLLDTRGGPRADFVMFATVRNLDLVTCGVRRLEGPLLRSNCDADPDSVRWGVARRDLDKDKLIRWRIVAFGGPGFTKVTDRAPDTGWYR
ncbi:MAG: hypothetical protein ACRDG8_03635 [Actinomycetota bacterium]